MYIKYSKPSIDVRKEDFYRVEKEDVLFAKQKEISIHLSNSELSRVNCILCDSPILGEEFNHREIPYIECSTCGHIQTKVKPPKGYPESVDSEMAFGKVYPKLTEKEYKDRQHRIYTPKLEWIMEVLEKKDYKPNELKSMTWTDIGCGAGYFLSSLKDAGVNSIAGLDSDPKLVEVASEVLGDNVVQCSNLPLEKSILANESNIYTCFFVLEHVEESHKVFKAIERLSSGTIFAFSVPVFGMSTLFEQVFSNNYARNLDSVVHTQLFSDKSIRYAADLADCEVIGQWIFGQDSMDFVRMMSSNLDSNYEKDGELIKGIRSKLSEIIDSVQTVFDQSSLADQRHLIMIKR